jgi:hypothetical protein
MDMDLWNSWLIILNCVTDGVLLVLPQEYAYIASSVSTEAV